MQTTRQTDRTPVQLLAQAPRRGPVPLDPALLRHVSGGTTSTGDESPRGRWSAAAVECTELSPRGRW